jgi:FtsH-binding integral membrane protein
MESRIVLQALILTSGVFIGLTLFTFQSKVGSSSIRSLFKERRLID